MSRPSYRIHISEHESGRLTAILLRHPNDDPFMAEAPPVSAYGDSREELEKQLGLGLWLRRDEEDLDRYLWTEDFELRSLRLAVHAQRLVDGQPTVGERQVPMRLRFAWCRTASGLYRITLPRFDWWMTVESLELAEEALRQRLLGALLGEEADSLYAFRFRGDERIETWSMPRSFAPPKHMEEGAGLEGTLGQVADDLVARERRREGPRLVGNDRNADALLAQVLGGEARSFLLVGDAGVGKTALVRRLAVELARRGKGKGREQDLPRLYGTSAERLIAGMTYLGDWQERCFALIEQLAFEHAWLFVDRLAPLVRPQPGGGSIAELLAPAVEAGQLRLIAEASPSELERSRRNQSKLIGAFELMRVEPRPASEMSALMARYHERSVVSSERPQSVDGGAWGRVVSHLAAFEPHHAFPGKGFAFVDWLVGQADGAENQIRSVLEHEATRVYARYSGLDEGLIDDRVALSRDELAERLGSRVVGQPGACAASAGVLARFKAGMTDPARPAGVLLFTGPTGVGKTALCRTLCRTLYGDESRLLRFDMSEYMAMGAAGRLLRAGEGVRSLTEAIRRQPLSVLLLDEIEKAHPEVFDLLLGVLDEGRLADELGRLADFRMAIIVMTSNLGAEQSTPAGFGSAPAADFTSAVRQHFRPELFNRIDEVVSFRALDLGDVERIVDLELVEIAGRMGLRRRGLRLEVPAETRRRLAELGFDARYGARPLRRVLEERVVAPIAERIASDPELRDQTVTVTL